MEKFTWRLVSHICLYDISVAKSFFVIDVFISKIYLFLLISRFKFDFETHIFNVELGTPLHKSIITPDHLFTTKGESERARKRKRVWMSKREGESYWGFFFFFWRACYWWRAQGKLCSKTTLTVWTISCMLSHACRKWEGERKKPREAKRTRGREILWREI